MSSAYGAQLGRPTCEGSLKKSPVSIFTSAGSLPGSTRIEAVKLQDCGSEHYPTATLANSLGPMVIKKMLNLQIQFYPKIANK